MRDENAAALKAIIELNTQVNPRNLMRYKTVKSIILACAIMIWSFAQAAEKPNILFILVDDMGWSDLGCYGSEIRTPNIDALADRGLRFRQFYNTAKCQTSRACLLTGTYAQQCKMMSPATIRKAVTLGEVLRTAGYRTLASGKHHAIENLFDRGFDHYYGLRDGACNFWNPGKKRDGEPEPGSKGDRVWCDDAKTYQPFTPTDKNFYATDAFTNKALEWLDEKELQDKPFLLYLAYTAPHYPLHAWPEDIAKYKGKYDTGYEAIRRARYDRMASMGIIDPAKNPLPKWEGQNWTALSGEERAKEIRRMEIYAAMLDRVDQNLGKLFAKLKAQGKFENTLIMFASDNGGCAELTGATVYSKELTDFGTVASFETVGESWATVQNTPLRKWKGYSQEGGIRTPFIVSWPARIKDAKAFRDQPGHLIDIMPTLVELTGATYPKTVEKRPITPMQGISLLPAFDGKELTRINPLFWQWSDGKAIREGNMKAVSWTKGKSDNWELYDMSENLNETDNLAAKMPEKLADLVTKWDQWIASVDPREAEKNTRDNERKSKKKDAGAEDP
jgi:arylsulfatase A-like enzyme